MQLFLKPFYCVDDDTPADSAKNWQCAVYSFAAHVFLFSIACIPVSAPRQIDSATEKIIMVTMVDQRDDCSIGSESEAGMKSLGSESQTNIQSKDAPAAQPSPAPEPKPAECPKLVKRTVSPVNKSKPVRIKNPKPETLIQQRPEPAMPSESQTLASLAPEHPVGETGTASSGPEISGSGAGLSESGTSEIGNHSEGGAGSPHGQGSKMKSGAGSKSGEIAFGSAGGPGFIHRALPRFPKKAQLLGIEGAVVLRLSLDHTGRLTHVEVVSGAGNGFDEEAVRAVQQSTFSPAVHNGQPVSSLALLSIRFNLGAKE